MIGRRIVETENGWSKYDQREPMAQERSKLNRIRLNKRVARLAVGVLLIVVLVAQFFATRDDIQNFSGIANVQVYMKGVFNSVIVIGIAIGVFIITRESPRSE